MDFDTSQGIVAVEYVRIESVSRRNYLPDKKNLLWDLVVPPHSFKTRGADWRKCHWDGVMVLIAGGYRLIGLRARSFLRGDNQTTWGWAEVSLKALVE